MDHRNAAHRGPTHPGLIRDDDEAGDDVLLVGLVLEQ